VVDRLKVRDDMRQRLAESFETALRHAEGRAIALEMDSGKEHLFSPSSPARCARYSLQELEPRLFSFNNPMGACPKCDGLGVIQFFDPARVVAHPHLSLAAGRDSRLGQAQPVLFPDHESLATHYGFDVDTPFEKLPGGAKR
jgi:excinuclease ABC subunit A